MVLSVLDGSTLRTPHNIYVLDGSTIRRVRQIRALDGSNIRHPFTKTDFFDFSGTANTLNPAVAEVYQYTVSNATNSGTQTVYTGIKPNIVILEQGLQLIITVGQIVVTILVLQHLEILLTEEI